MPLELRKILFSVPELQVAVIGHCRATRRPIPDADVARLVIRNDESAVATLHFRPSFNPKDPAEVVFTGDEVLAALIGYCRVIGIPLPRAAKKVLWPQDDGMSLMITLHTPGKDDRGDVLASAVAISESATLDAAKPRARGRSRKQR